MKKACWILIMFMSAIVVRAQTADKVYLVEVTEPTHEKTDHIVTMEGYQTLQAAMTATNRLLSKAIDLATKEWKEKHADLGPFPRQAASDGQVKSLGMFTDRAKAEQALQDIQAHEPQQQTNKVSGAEKILEQNQKQLDNLNGTSNPSTAQQTQIQTLKTTIKTLSDQIARQKKREKERESNLAIASDLVKGKLQQLLAEQQKKDNPPPVTDLQIPK